MDEPRLIDVGAPTDRERRKQRASNLDAQTELELGNTNAAHVGPDGYCTACGPPVDGGKACDGRCGNTPMALPI